MNLCSNLIILITTTLLLMSLQRIKSSSSMSPYEKSSNFLGESERGAMAGITTWERSCGKEISISTKSQKLQLDTQPMK